MADAGFERSLTEEKLHDAEQRLQKSLQQITVIDGQIRELEILYKRAQKSKKNASRYNLRLKLSVVSGKSYRPPARPSNTFDPFCFSDFCLGLPTNRRPAAKD